MFMRWYWAQFSILTSPSLPAAWPKKDSKCLKSLPVLQVVRPSGVSRSSSISRACLFQHLSLGSRPCENHVMFFLKFAELAAFLLQYLDPCLHSPSLFSNFINLHLAVSDHEQLQLQLRTRNGYGSGSSNNKRTTTRSTTTKTMTTKTAGHTVWVYTSYSVPK